MAPGLADGVPARGDPAARTTSSSTRSSTSRSSWCAPTTWGCVARSRTPAATAASRSSRAAGTCESGFTCPFHGWCYGLDGKNTVVPQAQDVRRAQPAARRHRPHAGAVRDVGRVRVDQPRRRRAAAAGVHRAVRHDHGRLEGRVAAHRVVVRVPPPGELEARRRGVRRAVPRGRRRTRSSSSPTRFGLRDGGPFDPRAFIDADIHYLRTMSEGMAGMVHANDVRIAEGLRDIELPADPTAGDGDLEPHAQRRGRALAPRPRARDIPDLNELEAQRAQRADVLLLPALLRAADVQQRLVLPLPPARTGGDADGDLVAHPVPRGRASRDPPTPPEAWELRRPPLAADPRAGLLEPAPPAAGPARQGLRVHAPVRAGSRATSRTSSGRSTASSPASPTSSCSRRCSRSTCTPSTSRSSTSASETVETAT